MELRPISEPNSFVDQYRALLPVLLFPRGQGVSNRCIQWQVANLPMHQKSPETLKQAHDTTRFEERNQVLLVQCPPGTIRLSIYHAITILLSTLLAVRCPTHR